MRIVSSIILSVAILVSFSCIKKIGTNKKNFLGSKEKNETYIQQKCFEEKDTIILRYFFDKVISDCIKDKNNISHLFTENVEKHYKSDFCSLCMDAHINREKIKYTIVNENDNCYAIITINSVEYYISEEGEKYRNEYSLFIYVIKKDNEIKINKIDGAG